MPACRHLTSPMARKKQKTEKVVRPLGSAVSLTDDASKDDEERRLESLLFGTTFLDVNDQDLEFDDHDEDDEGRQDGVGDIIGRELENMMDSDVRIFSP
jgi:U3 small nucleolar RNA-associated protein 18